MIKISNFNSLWEIAFIVNFLFVYLELSPLLNKKFESINALGEKIINKYMDEDDRRYINTYGWKSIVLGYGKWIKRLVFLSACNSFIAIILIILAGFDPELMVELPLICVVLLFLFTPIILIPAIIVFKLPLYKLECIEGAIENIINRDTQETEKNVAKIRKYKIVLEYIKFIEFYPLLWMKKNKEAPSTEILEKIKEYQY